MGQCKSIPKALSKDNQKNPFLPEIPEEINITPLGELVATKEALTKVQFPFFIGKKNNSTLYILGTCHALPLVALQKSALSYVKNAKLGLFEATQSAQLSFPIKKLYEFGILLPEHQENDNWYKQLSPEALSNLKQLVERFFSQKNIPPVPLKKINPEGAIVICCLAARPNSCIDKELINLFGENADSLEGEERFELFKKFKCSVPELESYLSQKNSPLSFPSTPFRIEDTKRNFRWIHKIIQASSKSKAPVLVAVGAYHLLGATGIISLLHQFGYEFSIIQDGHLRPYAFSTKPEEDPEGNKLLKNINSTISNKIEEMLSPALPDLKPQNIISSYLSFSIFPEHSRTLSEQIQVHENDDEQVSIELDLS